VELSQLQAPMQAVPESFEPQTRVSGKLPEFRTSIFSLVASTSVIVRGFLRAHCVRSSDGEWQRAYRNQLVLECGILGCWSAPTPRQRGYDLRILGQLFEREAVVVPIGTPSRFAWVTDIEVFRPAMRVLQSLPLLSRPMDEPEGLKDC